MATIKENILKVYRHEPVDAAVVVNDINFLIPIPGTEVTFNPAGECDRWGVKWLFDPQLMGFMPAPGHIVLDDISEWKEKVVFPDLSKVDWDGYAESVKGRLDPNKPTQLFSYPGLFERLHALMGMENAMCALLEDPEACAEFFDAVADWKIEYYRRIKEVLPIDIIRFSDDYGNSNSLMMSLSTWRELIKPSLKKVVDAVHEMGMLYRHHTDGVTIPLMDDFVDLGFDAVDPWQACNKDIRACKDKYQDKIVFVNGFDNQGVLDKPGVTEAELEREIMRTLETLAPGNGYLAEMDVFDRSKQAIFQKCVAAYNEKTS